jgi:hypothetical protein
VGGTDEVRCGSYKKAESFSFLPPKLSWPQIFQLFGKSLGITRKSQLPKNSTTACFGVKFEPLALLDLPC